MALGVWPLLRASGGAPSDAAGHWDGGDLAVRRRLLERRRALVGLRAGLRQGGGLEQTQGQAIAELSTYDNHPADIGTETWQRGQAVGMDADLASTLGEVDAALERLQAGAYGRCEACGGPIAPGRLAALPEARRCTACQEAVDAGAWRDKPAPTRAEEEVLSPPFARAERDGDDFAGFDGEDAWQAVARYGSSDTPADVPGAHRYPEIVEDADERHGAVEAVENEVTAEGEPILDVPEDDTP